MNDQHLLERITIDPQVLAGKSVIKGARICVEYILNLLAHGVTFDEILDEYQGLTQADIRACLVFAARSSDDASLQETAHVLRSPKNAERLFAALDRTQQRIVPSRTLDDVRHSVGLK
jgi:uncharacterized protein (DUF433 family)